MLADRFERVEWDEAVVPGIEAEDYKVVEGRLTLPEVGGFGLRLDMSVFGTVRGQCQCDRPTILLFRKSAQCLTINKKCKIGGTDPGTSN